MIGKQCRSRVALSVAAIAAAVTSALSFTAVASATTYTATDTASLASAITSANADTGTGRTDTITLAPGTYTPAATLAITNTQVPITIQGPAPTPNVVGQEADISGAAVVPTFNAALSIASGAQVTLQDVVVSSAGGSTDGALDDFGTLTGVDFTAQGNNGPVTVEPGGTATLTNSTVADAINTGVIDNGALTLTNSDVINSGAGGVANSGATLNLVNSIVVDNNKSVTTAKDCFAAATSVTTSIDGDAANSCGVAAPLASLDATEKFTSLAATLTNGGTTPTYAPKPATAAIGAATAADCPLTDQRGYTRPVSGCDIGAVQTSTAGPTLTSPSGTQTVTGTGPTAFTFTQTWAPAGFPIQTSTEKCTPASGSVFSGLSTVNCTAKDYYGNTGTGSFQVQAPAGSPPTVTITPAGGTAGQASITLPATSASGAPFTFTATSSDATDGTSDVVTCENGTTAFTSGSILPISSTPATITCSATNSLGLKGTASIAVTVADQSKPVITVPADISQFAPAGGSVNITYSPAPSATDLVDGTDTVTCTPASGSAFTAPATAGDSTTTTVSCSATDTQSLTTTKTFTVTITALSGSSQTGTVQGEVQGQLSLTAPALCDFGVFQVGLAKTYTCGTATTVTSTDPNATLNIQDTGTADPGHLINTHYTAGSPAFALTSPDSVVAASTTGTATSAATLSGTAAPILNYSAPVTGDPVALTFSQPIAATEVLGAAGSSTQGVYSQTVLLSLTTTA